MFDPVRTHSSVHQLVRPHDSRRGVASEGDLEDPLGQVATRLAASRRARFHGPRGVDESVFATGHQLRVHYLIHASEAIANASSTLVPTSSPKTNRAARAGPRCRRSSSKA